MTHDIPADQSGLRRLTEATLASNCPNLMTVTSETIRKALAARRSSSRESAVGSRASASEGGGTSGASMLEAFRDSRFLSGLTAAEAERVGEACVGKRFLRGETVLLEGNSVGAVRLMASGVVSLYRTSYKGKEHILRIVRSGEAFHDATAFDGCISLFSLRALAPSVLYTILNDDLQRLMLGCPRLAVNVVGLLAQEARHYVSLIEDMSFRDVPGRLAKVLLEYLVSPADGDTIRLTQQDMAAMTGTVREMVARSLKTMEDQGIIRLNRRQISIARIDALRELAEVGSWPPGPEASGG